MSKQQFVIMLFLFFQVAAICQSGPGGVLNSANNVFWLKAETFAFTDAGVTLALNGQNIQQWNDASGNIKHFSESVLGQRPTYITNVINGYSTIRFDGSNDRLSNLTITSGSSANFFAVIRYSSLPSSNPGIFQGSPPGLLLSTGGVDKVVGMWVSNANSPWGRGVQTNNTSVNIPINLTTTSNTNYILENQYNGTNINQYLNSNISGTTTYNGTLKSWTEFSIGRQGAETWSGDIAEMISFNTSINLAQRNIVNNYLSSKYNIGISVANDFYSGDTDVNGNYDFEVGGIGQASDGTSQSSFSTSVSGGMGLTYVSGFDNGDYVFSGHNLKIGNNSSTSDVGGMTGVENQRWLRIWYIDVTNSGANIVSNVKFDLSDGGLSGVTASNGANYVLLRRAGTSGNWTEFTTGASISGDEITFSNITLSDGYYTIGTKYASASPLPVEIIEFKATCLSTGVELNWSTASEEGNDHFLIEKSLNGINWLDIAKVKGNGTSNVINKYLHIDYSENKGITYYRLKQIDKNSSSEIFKAIDINCNNNKEQIVLYPNPASTEINILLNSTTPSGNSYIKVIDNIGQVVIETKIDVIKGINTFILPIDITAGTYYVTFSSDNIVLPNQKLLIVK